MSLNEKVNEETIKVCKEFWKLWDKITANYPDTDDALVIKILIMKSSLISLIIEYLRAFVQEDQIEQLEYLFDSAFAIALQLNDESDSQT